MINTLRRMCNVKTLSKTLILLIILITLPLLSIYILFASIYKQFCGYMIRRKDKYYVKFLDGFDAFWSIEEESAKSIIQILGIIESDSPENLVNKIKEKLEAMFHNKDTEKVFYRRTEDYGFYYWRKFDSFDVDEYVEIIDLKRKDNPNVDLENLMTDIQKQSLPYNDTGLIKILITTRVNSVDKEKSEYGIIFRIHHSIGDGVALIEYFCQIFADKTETNTVNTFPSASEKANMKYSECSQFGMFYKMQKICEIPVCLVDGILKKNDQNILHGPKLSGHKYFKWTAPDEKLIAMIKKIKENVAQLSFTDILLAAVSNGVQKYFTKNVAHIPEEIAVIVPVRFPKSASESKPMLKNDFSVIMLDLPLKTEGNIKEITKRCNDLKMSADPLTKFYVIKFFSSILPKSMLLKIADANQATMAFSNMPGPSRVSILGGNDLKSLIFFLPNTGTIGLGISVLNYGGDLRFAAIGDAAVIPRPEYLDLILEGMVEEVKRLHKQFVP